MLTPDRALTTVRLEQAKGERDLLADRICELEVAPVTCK